MKYCKNQLGIALLTELLLIGLVLTAGSAVAVRSYYANKAPKYEDVGTSAHQKKATPPPPAASSAAKKSTPSAADPYAGWKSCTTPTEKLTIRFPSDWSGACVKIAPNEGGVDRISVSHSVSPGVYSMDITVFRNDELKGDNDTIYNSTGAPPDDNHSIGESFKLNGNTVFLLTGKDSRNILLSATDGAHISFVPNKNVPGRFRAAFGYTAPPVSNPGHVVTGFDLKDPNVAVGKQILKSLHY